jgi:hypothetical protein
MLEYIASLRTVAEKIGVNVGEYGIFAEIIADDPGT